MGGGGGGPGKSADVFLGFLVLNIGPYFTEGPNGLLGTVFFSPQPWVYTSVPQLVLQKRSNGLF